MPDQTPLVTIHLTNQMSYLASVEEFEKFLSELKKSVAAGQPAALLPIRLTAPGEEVPIDPEGSFEAYLNPAAIALVDYI